MEERLINLFGKDNIEKIKKTNVLLVGVGGVGSVCFETLIRCGIKNITIIDFDTYEESNLNRQIHSNIKNIGMKKVDVLKEYAQNIDQNINITTLDTYLDDTSQLDFSKYDFIIDACDSIKAKYFLIKESIKNNINIICSLGVGNRKDSTKLEITTLRKTVNDPLGKKLRHYLNKEGIKEDVKVVSSKELPIKSNPISSYIAVSAHAGLLLADYVIKEVTK